MKKYLFCLFIFLFAATIIFANIDDLFRDEDFFRVEEQLVVTASRRAQKISEAPATVIVVTSQQIKERAYLCLDDIFYDLPGFDLVNVWGTWPLQWAQRGNYGDENKRTIVLIDGIIENNLMEGSVLGGQQYSLHNVEKIEIVYGPASALYGANAFGGIINILTKKGENIKGTEIEYGGGSWNTRFLRLLSGNKFENLSYSLSFSVFNSDGPVFSERHPQYDNSYIDGAKSIVTRLEYKNLELGINYYDGPAGMGTFSNSPTDGYGLPAYGWDGNPNESAGDPTWRTAQTGKKTNWQPTHTTFFLKGNSEFSEIFSVNSTLYFRETKLNDDCIEYEYFNAGWPTDTTGFLPTYWSHTSHQAGAEFQFNYSVGNLNNLIFGLQYNQNLIAKNYKQADINAQTQLGLEWSHFEKVDDINSKVPQIPSKHYAAFTQYEYVPENYQELRFTTGLRYDNNSIYGDIITPRTAMIWRARKDLIMKLLYGEAFRAPNNFEMYSTTDRRVSNQNLKPEKKKSYEFSFNYSLLRNLSSEINIFFNQYFDNITSNIQISDSPIITQNQNIGESKITGLELKFNYLLSNNRIEFNYTYQNPKDLTNNIQIPNTAKNKFNLILTNSSLPYTNINIKLNYVGARSTAITNPRNKIDGYTNIDLTLTSRERLLNNKLNWTLAVRNLLDTDYDDPGMRSAIGDYYGTVHPQPGRNIFGSLNYKF